MKNVGISEIMKYYSPQSLGIVTFFISLVSGFQYAVSAYLIVELFFLL